MPQASERKRTNRWRHAALHQALLKVFPNGCYLAFTGTPLLREEKNTVAKFGGLISSYTMEEAAREGARVFDFLRKPEPYKYAWGARDQINRRLTLAHSH